MAELIWSVDGDLAGELNMAQDRAMWRAFEADPSAGVRLRVYGWSPPALSLGFHQDDSAVDLQELEASGYSLVRRPTGGAAVLHVDEITYAVAAPLGLPGLGRAVQEIHDNIAGCLLELFAAIGLGVELGGAGPPRDFACFSAAGGHEMTVAGRKLVGSALRRGRRAFLQHGSVLCGDGHLELGRFMAGLDNVAQGRERQRLEQQTCTLKSLGVELDQEGFAGQLAALLAARVGMPARRVQDAPIRRGAEGP